ncbi:SPFH domain-containing protein [Uliginosibacterium paludis]|uniref:SPFH domain-containing protein n=1 Tax=Uliginosibacterium paludis TaxID=1615952 RepID=A0ABV2CTP5_9RHOO
MKHAILSLAALALLGACTRIETGEVGLRIDASKQVQGAELQPGSWNQTLIGSVLTFPVRDIKIDINDKTPMTADNSALADMDVTVVYGLNPSSVSDLWTRQSRSFHAYENGDWFLMSNYMGTIAGNAVYKSVREFKALEVNDKRAVIEERVKQYINDTLHAEKLDTSLAVTLVQVRNIKPAQSIIDSANAVVRAENELREKEAQVQIAKKEAERMAALANNSDKSIAYMNAQANLMIAEGIRNGKVNAIIVPADFKGMVNISK